MNDDGKRPTAADVFGKAVDLAGDARSHYLERACGGNDVLRAEVESLLAAHDNADDFLSTPALDADLSAHDSMAPEDLSGSEIGSYRLVRKLGSGGTGTVYLADRADAEFEKRVAVKLIRRGMDTDYIIERFQNERRLLASLEHANIARMIDGGVTDEGRPYLIMEYVEGASIEQYCSTHDVSLRGRIELFRTVCEAVHHAHRNLIVHRDLKPGNIFVNTSGEVKLLDFGIAKVLETGVGGSEPSSGGVTVTGLRMMTPRYASPEQVTGQPITTATDVYSLGVVLYELLTGARPYDLGTGAAVEVERVIRETEPTRPSAALEKRLRDGGHAHASRRARDLTGDLDNILLKAISKSPQDRYGSAEQFADDLERYLDGLPVRARAQTLRYRVAKFLRRNRALAAAGSTLFALLIGATALTTTLFLRSERALTEAESQRRKADRVSEFLQERMSAVDPVETQSGGEVTVREILREAADRIDKDLGEDPDVAAAMHKTIGNTYKNLGEYAKAEEHHRAEIALLEQIYTDDAPTLLGARLGLGRVLSERGENAAAESLYREVLAKVGHDESEEGRALVASLYRDLGDVRVVRGEYQEGRDWLARGLALRRTLPGERDEEIAGDLNSLGLLLVRTGEYESAVSHFREAIERMKTARGENHTFTGQIENNLGWAYGHSEQWEEAIPHFREALANYQGVLTADHPFALMAKGNFAQALQSVGDWEEAERVHREVIEGFRSRYGDHHAYVGHALNNYAMMVNRKEDYEGSANLYREALSIYREQLGDEHPYVAVARHNLAGVLRSAGLAAESEKECRATLDLRRRILRAGHPDIARSTELLGNLHWDRKEYREAEPLFVETVTIRKEAFPDGNAATAYSELLLGLCLIELGKTMSAEEHVANSREGLIAAHGADDARVLQASAALDRLRNSQSDAK